MNDKICVSKNGHEIYINVIYSKRRTIGLGVKNDLTVNVRAPLYTRKKDILRFVESKQDWLFKAYESVLNNSVKNKPAAYEDIYYDNALLPYRDGHIRLNIVKGGEYKKADVYYDFNERVLRITTTNESAEFIRECAVGMYRQLAGKEIKQQVAYYAGKMGVTYNRIFIKEQKTKWGSCSSRGNLNFNWKLVLMPPEILDYIVVHELAHRIQMNHSPAFWMLVEKVMPDYKRRAGWLKKHEREYMKY